MYVFYLFTNISVNCWKFLKKKLKQTTLKKYNDNDYLLFTLRWEEIKCHSYIHSGNIYHCFILILYGEQWFGEYTFKSIDSETMPMLCIFSCSFPVFDYLVVLRSKSRIRSNAHWSLIFLVHFYFTVLCVCVLSNWFLHVFFLALFRA